MREVARTVGGSVIHRAETISEMDEILGAVGGSFRYESGTELYEVRNEAGQTKGFVSIAPKGRVEQRFVDGFVDQHVERTVSLLKRGTGEGVRLGSNEASRVQSSWEKLTRAMLNAFRGNTDYLYLKDFIKEPEIRRCVKLPYETWRQELAAVVRKRMKGRTADEMQFVCMGYAIATGRHLDLETHELRTAKALLEIAAARKSHSFEPRDYEAVMPSIDAALAEHAKAVGHRADGGRFVEFVHVATRQEGKGESVLLRGIAPVDNTDPDEVETWGSLAMWDGTEIVVRRIGEDFFRPVLDPKGAPVGRDDFERHAGSGAPWRDNPFTDRPPANEACMRLEFVAAPCMEGELGESWAGMASAARVANAGRLVEIEGIVHKRCPEPQVEPVTISVARTRYDREARAEGDGLAVGWRLGDLSQYDDMGIAPDLTRSVMFGPTQFTRSYGDTKHPAEYSWNGSREDMFRTGFDGIDRLRRMVSRLAETTETSDDSTMDIAFGGGVEDVEYMIESVRRMLDDDVVKDMMAAVKISLDSENLWNVDFGMIDQTVFQMCPRRFIEHGAYTRRRLVPAVVAFAEAAAWKIGQPSLDEDLSSLFSM